MENDYLKKFNRCILEYTNASGSFQVDEEGEEDAMGGGEGPALADPMGGAQGGPMGGGEGPALADPMGGAQGDPSAMGGDPSAMGGGPEGFQPQGVDPNGGAPAMGGAPTDPNAMGGEDEEVIDVDDLTKSQENAEKKIDAMSEKFSELLKAIKSIQDKVDENEANTYEAIMQFKTEMERRNPTPVERMTMRSTKSMPYGDTPDEWWKTKAPENYSSALDNNGADDPQYQITKDDIDKFTDWQSISKGLDLDNLGLDKILGY